VNTRISGVLELLKVRVSDIEHSNALANRIDSFNETKNIVTSPVKYCKI
jgi:hypothetical protein